MMKTADENRIRKIRRTLKRSGYLLRKWAERYHICDLYGNYLVATFGSLEEVEEYAADLMQE